MTSFVSWSLLSGNADLAQEVAALDDVGNVADARQTLEPGVDGVDHADESGLILGGG